MRKIINILLVYIFFKSCEKDLVINFKDAEIKQVINGTIRENSKVKVYISKSKLANDNSSVEFISNATVQLFEDGIFIENLNYEVENGTNKLGYYISNYRAQANHTYKITSKVENLKDVEASEFLHAKADITQQSILKFPTLQESATRCVINFTIKDNGNEQNCYMINVYEKIKTYTIDSLLDTIFYEGYYDPNIKIPQYSNEETTDQIFIKDTKFNGTEMTFTIEFDGTYYYATNVAEQLYIFDVSNIGEAYYNYFYYQQLYKGGISNSNKEPISLISNIKNGYGQFSSINTKTFIYKIQ